MQHVIGTNRCITVPDIIAKLAARGVPEHVMEVWQQPPGCPMLAIGPRTPSGHFRVILGRVHLGDPPYVALGEGVAAMRDNDGTTEDAITFTDQDTASTIAARVHTLLHAPGVCADCGWSQGAGHFDGCFTPFTRAARITADALRALARVFDDAQLMARDGNELAARIGVAYPFGAALHEVAAAAQTWAGALTDIPSSQDDMAA
ncbi:hypothetical protein [Catenuloplanes japonicus]|uniref:hypothetical protein n=1 Tax=Catenuloplanes japonicus TaxID=33876 RepID=UPI000527CF80|nr:hypothetical protein [Catenuloplanes japonicus]